MSLLESLFGAKQPADTIDTPLSLVTHAASLASKPADIDMALDRVRSITSQLQPGQSPIAEAIQTLLAVYLQIESYLTTNEPIRTFTKAGLRQHLSPELAARLQAYESNHKEP